jgi:phosphate transport system permease protein
MMPESARRNLDPELSEPMQSIDPTIALEGVHVVPDVPVRPVTRRNAADRVFRTTVTSAGALTLALMALIGLFLLVKSWDALRVAGLSFLTTAQWEPNGGVFGIAAVLLGTVLISFVALAFAVRGAARPPSSGSRSAA